MVVLSLLACGPDAMNELPQAPREGDHALVVRALEVARPVLLELRFEVDGGRTWTWRDEIEPEERVVPLAVQFRERVRVEVLVDGTPVPEHTEFEVGPEIGDVLQSLGPVSLRGRVTLPEVMDQGPSTPVDEAAGPSALWLEPRAPDATPLRIGATLEEVMRGWQVADARGKTRQLGGLRLADGTTRKAGIVAFAEDRVHDIHLQLADQECVAAEERLLAAYGEPTTASEAPLKSRRWVGERAVAIVFFTGERCSVSWRAAPG